MVFHCRCFSFDDDKNIARSRSKSTYSNLAGKPKEQDLRVFTFAELKAATNNFSSAWKIREGRHGSLYMGMVKSLENPSDKIPVAINYVKGVTKEPLDLLSEISFHGMVDHPNLVKLVIGYCMEIDNNERGTQLLLVCKYMPKRSVRDHLSPKSETPLSWTIRLKVAQDAARGLAYLHEGMDFQILYQDFNSSKLLLDDQKWNAMLSDLVVAPVGSQGGDSNEFEGNAAPEYILTGQVSSKSDVWSYGVFLYELITGRQPLDRSRPQNEQKLLEWVKPYVQSKNLEPIIDPRLEDMYSMKSVEALVTIANLCLREDPRSRIDMNDVLELLRGLIGIPSQVTSPVSTPKIEPVNVVNGVPSHVTNPASNSLVQGMQRSKLLKSWSKKVCCHICLAPST